MCCREGAEKPPKPPKSISIQIQQSKRRTAGSKSKSPQSDKLIKMKSKLKPTITKVKEQADSSKIEVINLAGSKTKDNCSKGHSQDYKKLHKLHDRIVGNTPARIIISKRPSVPFAKTRQPQISFLSPASNNRDSLQNTPSDGSSDFMEDLPSPSTLLQTHSSITDASEMIASAFDDNTSDLEASVINPFDAVKRCSPPQASSADCTLPSGDDLSGVHQMTDGFRENLSGLSSYQLDATRSPSLQVEDHGNSSTAYEDSRLFLTTSSPEKQSRGNKDTLISGEGLIGSKKHKRGSSWEDTSFATKRKLSISQPCPSSLPTDDHNFQAATTQPFRNMEGIDLDYLLAEYGDIIEFID